MANGNSTFLELPLDRDLYKSKSIPKYEKPPLRVLITEAGTKAAHHLMYKICSGQVFGPDQKIILHLVNAKGSIDHKAILLDLEICGFPAFKDSVVSSEPEKSYGEVDYVILIALFEELSGYTLCGSFVNQVNKARQAYRWESRDEKMKMGQLEYQTAQQFSNACSFKSMFNNIQSSALKDWMYVQAKNMCLYAKPDSKLIVCSPSTKGVIVLLTCLRIFEPHLQIANVTGVTLLDVTIAKCHIAAQLKTTTDKIKNIVIWGATAPDLRNATVLMYPPDDKALLEKVEIPVLEALENHKWVYSKLIPSIYKRVLGPDLAVCGGALASATASHLKLLFQGSEFQKEIISMGTIIPSHEPYGLTKNIGFSIPVITQNGSIRIREDITYETTTHLMNLRSMYNLQNDVSMKSLYKLINYVHDYEEKTEEDFLWYQHGNILNKIVYNPIIFKYFISPRFVERPILEEKEEKFRKSVTWNEEYRTPNPYKKLVKSVLRFNLDENGP